MKTKLGSKIRKIRELKGFSQEYMAHKLSISQRAYSKLERNEIKIDWDRINEISDVLEVNPIDLINFDDNLIFNNCTQSGKFENFVNHYPDKLIEVLENQISDLKVEIEFLRSKI